MNILIVNRQRKLRINTRNLKSFTELALTTINPLLDSVHATKKTDVSIAIVGDQSMRRYNRDFRGKDRPTDVLSFPSDTDAAEFADYLGDIIISAVTADRDAKELSLTFEVELRMLIIHGLLHLHGYDHEADNGEMGRLERRLRRKLL
jgi:probable rRNA maturation factor